jgi:single-strand DNA-binding protein
MDNTVTLVGALGKDPELRYTTGGRGVASFSIAVSRRWKQNDEWQEQTSWFNIVAWSDLGENCAASLVKGNRVIVQGRLEQRDYTDREGNKRYVTEVIADAVGPDLRWATAEVTRIERDKPSGGGQSRSRQPDPVYGDEEEPF